MFQSRFLAVLTLSLASLILAGCSDSDGQQPAQTTLQPPSETGVLKVATRNGSTTYYLDRHENPIGPEHALVSAYAEARGWEVEWTMLDSTSNVLDALASGKTHLAAAGLTHLPSRDKRFARGPAHTEITEQLVCHRDARPLPRKPEDIPGTDIVVTAGSSYVETLNTLNEQYPGIGFREDADRTTEVILSAVAEQDIGCTVADSNIVQVMRRHFPHLEVAMTLTDGRNLGWYLPAGSTDLADDARELARTLNKNPDSWEDMSEVLPLKADKRYYPSTRYGYARGYEPVHYVQRIRNYRDVIRSAFE